MFKEIICTLIPFLSGEKSITKIECTLDLRKEKDFQSSIIDSSDDNFSKNKKPNKTRSELLSSGTASCITVNKSSSTQNNE